MAELGSSNVNGDLRTTGDHTVGENCAVEGNSDTKGILTEKGQRVFSPNNRNLSNSTGSASATVGASSLAVKTAYDKGVQALNTANGKLGAGSKAVDSDKLDGQDSSYFAKASQVLTNVPAGAKFTDTNTWRSISDSVSQVSNSISASLTAVKAAYDRATQALNIANSKLGATAKAVDSDKVDGFHASQSAGAKSSVVVSDSSGYIKGTYFNSNRGDEASAAKSYIYDTGDGFMRKKTTANARNELVVASDVLAKLKGVDGSGSGLDADLLDGLQGSQYAKASQVLTNVPAGAKFTDTNTHRSISDSVGSTSTSVSASSKAVKTAYDKGVDARSRADSAYSLAAGKLAAGGKAVDSDKLDGLNSTSFNVVVARFNTGASSTSRVKIRLPFKTNSAKMLKFTISLYSGYTPEDYDISGYLYPATNNWYEAKAFYTGAYTSNVIMGRDSDGYAYVSIAGRNYVGCSVHSVTIGYTGSSSDAINTGWSISQDNTTPDPISPKIYTVWHSRNDGSGSGLDADLLGGLQSNSYGIKSATNTWSGSNTFTSYVKAKGFELDLSQNISWGGAYGANRPTIAASSNFIAFYPNGSTNGEVLRMTTSGLTVHGSYVWHAGNDGSGSGLDADLLDGQHGSYYASASSVVRKSGDTMSGRLLINTGNGLEVKANSGWSYLTLSSGGSEAHLAKNSASAEGVAANSLHLRPAFNYQGSLMLQPNSSMRHRTTHGYINIGSLNAGYAHFETDRPYFHFDKPIRIQGEIYAGSSYNQRVYHTGYKPSAADVGLGNVPNWSTATFDGRYLAKGAKAVDSARLNGVSNSTGASANYIAQRDGAGDLQARLFRSNYGNESRVSGAMAFRVNNSSDNYIRFCSSPAAIRDWLGVYDKNEVNAKDPKAWVLLRNGAQNWNYTSPVDLRGKEVFFLQTDQRGRDETSTAKSLIPHTSGFHADQRHYIYAGNCKIEYEYSTRKIYVSGELGNRQIWYRDPSPHDYPPIGIVKP